MSDHIPIHTLPAPWAREAAELLQAEGLTSERRELKKRFRPGLTSEDVSGFYLQNKPLHTDQLPSAFFQMREDEISLDHDPAMPRPPADTDESWLAYAERLQASLSDLARSDPALQQTLEKFHESEVIPAWVGGNQPGQRRAMQPFVRHGEEGLLQAKYRHHLSNECPQLAQYFVPMLPFRVSDSEHFSIMPFLAGFDTLDELFWAATGLAADVGSIAPAEAERAFELVLRELVKIIRLASERPTPTATQGLRIFDRMRTRFSAGFQVSLLISEAALEAARRDVLGILETKLEELWRQTRQFTGELGHGDLNATNILVAFRRDQRGEIVEACVRLIDTNPRGIPQHGLLELGRLLHWLELGSALRASRERGRALIEVHFNGTAAGHQFLNESPSLRFVEPEHSAALRSYQLLLRCLSQELPDVNTPPARAMLSLGVGLYHLIAARHWPRNHDRVCAFWAGVNEIRLLQDSGSVTPDNGLWSARRNRGRATC